MEEVKEADWERGCIVIGQQQGLSWPRLEKESELSYLYMKQMLDANCPWRES